MESKMMGDSRNAGTTDAAAPKSAAPDPTILDFLRECCRSVEDMLPMLEALAEYLDIDPAEACEADGVCAAWACREAGCIVDKIRRAEDALTRAAIGGSGSSTVAAQVEQPIREAK